jgi:hypothetical protein
LTRDHPRRPAAPSPVPRVTDAPEAAVDDLLMLLIVIGFFAACLAYIAGIERL